MNEKNEVSKVTRIDEWRRRKSGEALPGNANLSEVEEDLRDFESAVASEDQVPPPAVPPAPEEMAQVFIPSDSHPDPAIRLSAELTRLVELNKHTCNPVEMLVALSLAFTGVVRAVEIEHGQKAAEQVNMVYNAVIQNYKMVFQRGKPE